MPKRIVIATMVALLAASIASPVVAHGGSVDIVRNFDSVIAVARPDDFPARSLMRAECSFVLRAERPDGSASEIQYCRLSDEPVMIPENQGVPPSRIFLDSGGPCVWFSDYWFHKNGSDVVAGSFRVVVTPSGHVVATSTYPATPLTCE